MNTGILDDSVKDYYRLFTASKTEKSVKQKMRYDVVLLYMEGYPGKQISQILHIPLRTVSYHPKLPGKIITTPPNLVGRT